MTKKTMKGFQLAGTSLKRERVKDDFYATPECATKSLMEKEVFIELCKKLGINIEEYLTCAYCKKSIFGCCTMGKKGYMCSECESKEKEKL